MKFVDHVQFRPGLPFYDMVTSFMVSLAASPAIFNKDNPMNLEPGHYIAVEGKILDGKHFKPYDVYQLVQGGHISWATYIKSCCSMLANSAYEAVKERNDHSPEFELLRHIRNAASHGNKFYFSANEPSRLAAWKSFTLGHHLRGASHPFFGKECFGRSVGISDLIDLLADIEQRFI